VAGGRVKYDGTIAGEPGNIRSKKKGDFAGTDTKKTEFWAISQMYVGTLTYAKKVGGATQNRRRERVNGFLIANTSANLDSQNGGLPYLARSCGTLALTVVDSMHAPSHFPVQSRAHAKNIRMGTKYKGVCARGWGITSRETWTVSVFCNFKAATIMTLIGVREWSGLKFGILLLGAKKKRATQRRIAGRG